MVIKTHDRSVEIWGRRDASPRGLQQYEERPQQLEMARAVAAAIEGRRHLIVEAGTGVGKSFAYLVPAILAATAEPPPSDDDDDENRPRRRIVVSTHTIALQEQLVLKDIPLLKAVMPNEFTAVLVKGRGNYVSLRRLKAAQDRARNLFIDDSEIEQLRELASWAKQTTDGSLADLPFSPHDGVWDEIASDSGNCMGRNCPTYDTCFYYQARRRASRAQILVVNHALFFSDLALRRAAQAFCPITTSPFSTKPTRSNPSPAITWAWAFRRARSSTRSTSFTTTAPTRACWCTTNSALPSRKWNAAASGPTISSPTSTAGSTIKPATTAA